MKEELGPTQSAVIADLMVIRDELAADLETALNLVRGYQGFFVRLNLPDPGLIQARKLLIKYKMPYAEPEGGPRVYADGVDITVHPDSVPGTADEMPEPDRIELIKTEDGKMHFRPVYDELTIEGSVAEPEEFPTDCYCGHTNRCDCATLESDD